MPYSKTSPKLFYTDTGKGKPVVLLHGFLGSSVCWDACVETLLETHRVLTFDCPAHGNSKPPQEGSSLKHYASQIALTLHDLKLANVCVVGHSLGGYIALELLRLIPEKIQTFVLLNSTCMADSSTKKLARNRAANLLLKSPEMFVRMAYRNLISESRFEELRPLISKRMAIAKTFPPKGLITILEAMRDRPDYTKALQSYNGKKYWLQSYNDSFLDVNLASKIAAQTHCNFKTFNGGHLCLIEQPNVVASLLRNILA